MDKFELSVRCGLRQETSAFPWQFIVLLHVCGFFLQSNFFGKSSTLLEVSQNPA